MTRSRWWSVAVIGAAICCIGASSGSAGAAGLEYNFDPLLSLSGNCSTTAVDEVPDPSCPYSAPPDGPSGRFNEASSIAIDAYGNEYVASYAHQGGGRIDVFDDEGRFITEVAEPQGPFSIAVDSEGNLYAYEGGPNQIVVFSPSLPYAPESGGIEYEGPPVVVAPGSSVGSGPGLAVNLSNDHLFTASGSSIREFGSAAEGNPLLNTITNDKLGSWSTWVAVDAERGRLYSSYCKDESVNCGVLVFELSAPYGLLKEIDGSTTPAGKFLSQLGLISVAVDEENGHFFADDMFGAKKIYEFGEEYEYLSTISFPEFVTGRPQQVAVSNSPLNVNAFNRGYLFVPVMNSLGRALAFKRGAAPPEVESLSAGNIGESEAELSAKVASNGATTTYRFEIVSQLAFELSGFEGAQIVEGTVSAGGSQIVKAAFTNLDGGTTYRFRIRAENETGEDEEHLEGGFTTYSDAPITDACPNQDLRLGASALLPDCRAYELVTPPDTNGHPPKGIDLGPNQFSSLQASPAGDAVSFLIREGGLPGSDVTGTLNGDPYRATRGASGWSTTPTGPSGAEALATHAGGNSPDQHFNFWQADSEGSAVFGGEEVAYVRYPDGHTAAVGRGSLGIDPKAKGRLITENGTHIVFQTFTESPDTVAQPLEPDAPPTGTEAVYDRTSDEVTHVVSLLPGNITPDEGEDAEYLGASTEGNGIAFEIEGTLYLRLNNSVTYEIGEGVEFAGVADGGARIFYVEGGDLFAFDAPSGKRTAFTEVGNATVVNVAPQGTRAYFASTSAIPEAGENPNGELPKAGKQNLYLSEEGTIRFVATVTQRDVEGEVMGGTGVADGLGVWTKALEARQPSRDPSRVTPDGSVLLFQSRADLDGYDPGGYPEIFRFDLAANRLHCLSCIPTGEPARGGASLETFSVEFQEPPPFSAFGFVPNLRADGRRAFFESTEALIASDTDEVQDVYEWEEGGVGSCTRPGGCVYLISSGESERDNYLYGHSASGDDVFFVTGDSLAGGDAGDTPSIYDARVGGGFAEVRETPCSGEGCGFDLPAPPALSSPDSGVRASGNVRKHCPKGKRKVKRHGKVRCVKKHKKYHRRHRKAGTKKGASR